MELVVDNGKVQEPTLKEKVKAAVTFDKEVYITLPFAEVQKIVGYHIFNKSEWLNNDEYKSFGLGFNTSTQQFTLTLYKK